jgi:transposase
MLEMKIPVDTAAEVAQVDRSTLLGWWREYRAAGARALRTKKTRGPAAKLSPTQLAELSGLLVGADPRQLSFGFALWTRPMVAELIRRRFGVRLSLASVGRVLRGLGLSPQRPLHRAYQQDPEKVAEWRARIYPQIRARAAAEGAEIFFADEAAVRTDFHAGTTWAPVGQTPVVAASGARRSIMMISAVSAKGKLRFMVTDTGLKAPEFIEFCRRLLHDTSGKVFLIVDGNQIHRAKIVKEFIAATHGRLELFFLPPYSPELNPDEWVWKNVKADRVGRAAARSQDELKHLATHALRRLQNTPQLVRAFFRDPHLAYIH